jgi:hypothetical protein
MFKSKASIIKPIPTAPYLPFYSTQNYHPIFMVEPQNH